MKKRWAFVALPIAATVMVWCGTRKEKIVIPAPATAPTTPLVTCNGIPEGNVRSLVCADAKEIGSINQECKSGKWETTSNDCKPVGTPTCKNADLITFKKDVKPLIDAKCISCHKAIELDEYENAKGYIAEIIARVADAALDTKRMPPAPNDPLSFKEQQIFSKWLDPGKLVEDAECPDPDDQTRVDFIDGDEVRTSVKNALRGLSATDKLDARFLDNSARVNLGASETEKDTYKASVNKAINSISNERDIVPCTEIDDKKAVCRIDLDSLGMTAADWDLIVQNAVLVLQDNTDDGLFIQQQTGTKIPILAGDQFVRAALDFRLSERQRRAVAGEVIVNPYYAILDIPVDQKAYFAQKGVDLQKIFDDFEALCGGVNLSPISLLKNRLVCFVESDDGRCSISFDPVLAIGKSNVFQNPFVFAKSDKLFQFEASEVICDQENGGQEYSLWNTAGVRQDAAPENIVKNIEGKGGDTQIRNGKTCNECHSKGLINIRDELRVSILENSKGNFNADELDFTRLMYGSQGRIDTLLASHNGDFKIAMTKVAVNVATADPINYTVDRFVKQWTLNEVCAFIKIPLAQCKLQIDQSRALNEITGSLTSGGTISFDLLVDTFPLFIKELRLGEEPIERR